MFVSFLRICPQGRGAERPEHTHRDTWKLWVQLVQAGANELVFILFYRSGLNSGQKYPEENFSRLELTLYRQNVVFTSLSQVLGKVKQIPGN